MCLQYARDEFRYNVAPSLILESRESRFWFHKLNERPFVNRPVPPRMRNSRRRRTNKENSRLTQKKKERKNEWGRKNRSEEEKKKTKKRMDNSRGSVKYQRFQGKTPGQDDSQFCAICILGFTFNDPSD